MGLYPSCWNKKLLWASVPYTFLHGLKGGREGWVTYDGLKGCEIVLVENKIVEVGNQLIGD